MLSDFLLPVMEERIIQWTHTLRSICRHEYYLCDRLRSAIMKLLKQCLSVLVNGGLIQHESERISVQSLHRLCEYIVDELHQHSTVDTLHVGTLALGGNSIIRTKYTTIG